jgi:ATP-binding cassette, subfamily C, bacterial CydC
MLLSILCAWGSSLSAAALMAASAYIITSAALQPPLYTLSMAITAVRFFGISRALLRYLERYLSHDASFRLLGLLRAFAYKQLESRIPLKLQASSQGIFLNHLINDIDVLKDFYLRVFAPISSAFLMLLTLCIILFFYSTNSVCLLCLPLLSV